MHSLPAEPSFLLKYGFILLSIGIISGLSIALRSYKFGLLATVWLVVSGLIGVLGLINNFSAIPPYPLVFFVASFAGVFFLMRTSFGARVAELSLTFLVGAQAFRIIVELLIHQAVVEGIAPPQMTWSGLNFDILTGISALILIPFASRIPRKWLLIWNWVGLALLAWVVGVAALSMPTPFQQITPDNVWIAFFPFIWLPTIAVLAALIGHLALFRKLRLSSQPAPVE